MSLDLSPLRCNVEEFRAIYQNLGLFKKTNHEHLVLSMNDRGYFPITAKKEWTNFSGVDQKTTACALIFFERNLNLLAKQADPHQFLSKFSPLFKADSVLKYRYYLLGQKLFHLYDIQNKEKTLDMIIQQREQKSEALIQEAEQKGAAIIEEAKLESKLLIKQANRHVRLLESRLSLLKEEMTQMEDALLICNDGNVSSHIKILVKVRFFHCYKDNFDHKMKENYLTLEEQQKYKYIFDFKDYDSKTLFAFLDWLDDSRSLYKIVDFNQLYEIYRLADYLNDLKFQNKCALQLKRNFNLDNVCKILAFANYSNGTPLIREGCLYAKTHFNELIKYNQFLEIQHEYFIHILKDLVREDEFALFCWVLKWTENQAKKTNNSVEAILYELVNGDCLINCIKFQNISQEKFILDIVPRKVLRLEHVHRLYEFYLTNHLKKESTYFLFQFSLINNFQGELNWNIPLSKFYNINEEIIESEMFSLGNSQWFVFLMKSKHYSEKLILGIQRNFSNQNFDVFLQINHFRIYSDSSDFERKAQTLKDEDEDIEKSFYFTSEELITNLDLERCCLPIKLNIFIK